MYTHTRTVSCLMQSADALTSLPSLPCNPIHFSSIFVFTPSDDQIPQVAPQTWLTYTFDENYGEGWEAMRGLGSVHRANAHAANAQVTNLLTHHCPR